MLLFPEGESPIYINGIASLKRYFEDTGNARRLAIKNDGETRQNGVKIIAVPKDFVMKFELDQYKWKPTKRDGSRANAGTKEPYTPTKTSTDEN